MGRLCVNPLTAGILLGLVAPIAAFNINTTTSDAVVALRFGLTLRAETWPSDEAAQLPQADTRKGNRPATQSSTPETSQEAGRERPGPTPTISVLIYNYARVRRQTVSRAGKAAKTVFERIGAETVWFQCATRNARIVQAASCPEQLGSPVVVVRILSKAMAKRVGLHPDCFGFALPGSGQAFGSIANVFYHRLGELARSRGEEERSVMLGHMLAHEIGHLLLGRNSHSSTGIMHVPWDAAQLDRARFQNLRFTSGQGQRIRRQVLKRLAAE